MTAEQNLDVSKLDFDSVFIYGWTCETQYSRVI